MHLLSIDCYAILLCNIMFKMFGHIDTNIHKTRLLNKLKFILFTESRDMYSDYTLYYVHCTVYILLHTKYNNTPHF